MLKWAINSLAMVCLICLGNFSKADEFHPFSSDLNEYSYLVSNIKNAALACLELSELTRCVELEDAILAEQSFKLTSKHLQKWREADVERYNLLLAIVNSTIEAMDAVRVRQLIN